MSKTIRHIARVVTVFILTNIFSPNAQAKEPSYNGKPLSEWICCALPDDQYKVFQHLGTNSLPVVLDIMGATDKNMKWVAMRLESRELREKAFSEDEGTLADIRESASRAFDVLKTNAVSAVPRLIKILNQNDEITSIYAADALTKVGPKGFIALTNVLSHAAGKANTRTAVISEIVHGDFKIVEPMIVDFLRDKNPDVRRFAVEGLGGRDPDEVIPLLIPVLDDPDLEVRATTATSLSTYGAKAVSAIPKIVFDYTNGIAAGLSLDSCRLFAGALKAIDLEEARKTEALVVSDPINPYRFFYTRTKLTNGLELVAGGYIKSDLLYPTNHYLSTVELYNPKTGKWIETGEMTTIRYDHAAVLIPNGNVLIVGGENEKNSTLSTAELYDPSTGRWTQTTTMHSMHFGCKAILNPDGTVLVYQEFYNNAPPPDKIIEKCEQFDPANATWTVVSSPLGKSRL